MKIKILILILIIVFFSLPSITSAHIQKVDGSITSTLHVDPADDPGVGEISKLEFTLVDTNKKVDLTQCDCFLKITSGNGDVLNENIKDDKQAEINNTGLTVPFIFPSKAVYTIIFSGNATGSSSFQTFLFSYDIRVDRNNGESIPFIKKILDYHLFQPEHYLHILLFGAAIIISIYVIVTDKKA